MITNNDEAPNITPVQKTHSIALRQSKDQRLNIDDRVHNHGPENADMSMLSITACAFGGNC
jgi:hypothetical protein|tara:strand:- start:326 stop:508 length:183 start_codon:yes stop_codon:yes gene_type:complete